MGNDTLSNGDKLILIVIGLSIVIWLVVLAHVFIN
jgi:hypothetical protein